VFFYDVGFACFAVPFLKEQHSGSLLFLFQRNGIVTFSAVPFGYHCSFSSKKQRSFIAVVPFSKEWHFECFYSIFIFAVPFPKGTAFVFLLSFFSIIRLCFFSKGTPLAYFCSPCETAYSFADLN